MKRNTFYTLLLAGVITLAGMFAGCTEYADDPAEFTTENIVINYTDSVIDASISSESRTRSVSESTEISSGVLTSQSGKKMYLSCTEAPWPVEKSTVTRGAKVNTASISSMGVSASVYGSSSSYTSAGCGSYFYKESVSSGTPTRFYWPTSDYKISFFGYYPYNNAAFTVQSAASATGAPTYAYTVPSTISSQQDIMTGQVTDRLGGSASAVNMTLSHRCAAIRFNITNDRSEAITVNSISIEGVKYTGTLSGSTWTLGNGVNSSSTNPFILSHGSSIAAGATVDITGTSNVFMMLPQSLPATAKLKVVVDDEEFETELTGTWVAGNEYTYNASMSAAGPIDLSMVDNAGNKRSSMTTANCYMVHDAGDYKIPLVYGNAIKNGNANSTSYAGVSGQLYPFVNHAGTGINGPWITKSTSGTGVNKGMGVTVNGAELLWQDASGLISAVGIDGDYLTFTVPAAASSKAGNALIAAKSGSTIVWSWHIWVTTETLAPTTSIATGSHTYRVAPVNLGWIPTDGSGKQGYCTYYQWGRKDPFIPAASYSSTSSHTVYNISNSSVTGITYSGTGVTIADNIKNPTTHYCYSSNYGPVTTTYYNMWDAQNTTTNNVTSATKKTIYDPCPPGFCVPTGNLYYFMAGNSGGSRSDANWTTNQGKTWSATTYSSYTTGNDLFFPAAGYRNSRSGSLSIVGLDGYYWSATPYGTNYGRSLNFYSSSWYWSSNHRAYGFSVRPVAEE